MTNKRESIIAGSIILVIAIGYGCMATRLPARNFPNTLGIDAMPRVFSILLGLLSLMLIGSAFFGKKTSVEKRRLTRRQVRGVFIVFVMLTAYVLLMAVVGFPIVTPLAMFGLMYIEGTRRYPQMIIVSLITTGVVYVLFRFVFGVRIVGIAFL